MQRQRARSRMFHLEPEQPPPATRTCDHPLCGGSGEFRAPKGRNQLNEYYWFCLDHVREYNRAWDFYAGMNADQIEAAVRQDTTWQRPSWPMGEWRTRERMMRDRVMGDFAFGHAWSGEHEAPKPKPRTPHDEALSVLDLEAPVEFHTIKARYRELVKQHHPDTHAGDKVAEETLKRINQAYTTLKAAFGGT